MHGVHQVIKNRKSYRQLFVLLCSTIFFLSACDDNQKKTQEQALQEQAKEQGYPVLIASPHVADYGLPFCEKKYCIEIEIQSFQSQDTWFNQFTDFKISELIRKQLDIKEKLTLQQAVDAFVAKSDSWQAEHPNQPWSMQISSRVPMQQKEIAVLQLQTTYVLGDKTIPEHNYFFMVDRKAKKQILIYDVIKPEARLAFGDFIQQAYQKWQEQLGPEYKDKTPSKIGWASQDWLIDEQGVTLYYRASDLQASGANNLIIQIPKDKVQQWFTADILQKITIK